PPATAALLPPAGAVLTAGLLAAAAACAPLALAGRRGPRRAAARGAFAAAAADLVRGAADLEVLGAADAAVHRAERAEREAARLELRADRAMGAASTAVLLLQGLTAVAVAWLALTARQDGGLDPVLPAVLAVTALAAFEPVAALPAAARRYGGLSEGAARLAAVLDAPAPVAEPPGPGPEPRGSGVEVRGLRARYGPGRPWALDGLDLNLAPGTTTALAGASGSGKSTLVDVLLRFLDYEGGSVRLGGAELRDVPGDRVRRSVAGLTRHDRVLHASVRDNLLLARPEATDGELRRAASRVRLLAWIESLPQGWDTVPGEDGAAMSGGQRLRLLLARALLADPQVLVLDEPTEGLDAATAEAVLADVLRAARGRTVLLVSHHPAALAAADEVHSIAEGGARPAEV
ncbi:ATP-binding cassette domain-containing protein, partial [Nocardiopsis sp. RSe5-2]